MSIIIGGLDPSLRNFGMAKGLYLPDDDSYTIRSIHTEITEQSTAKTVRQSSDDLRCAGQLVSAMQKWIADCTVVFAEVPSGSQSARGSFSNGICLGVMGSVGAIGSCKARIIQVTPTEVKKCAVGSKNASKEEMVEWASEKFPYLPWIRGKSGKFKGVVSVNMNEHMADAIAAINAGVQTSEFRNLVSVIESLRSSE